MLRILLSPAKKIATDAAHTWCGNELSIPAFMPRVRQLVMHMQGHSVDNLMRLMRISEPLAQLNYARYQAWDMGDVPAAATAAGSTFQGDAYRALDLQTMQEDALRYLSDSLYILSGLYGLLRTSDAMLPYRLEMGTRVAIDNHANLYDFWADTLAHHFRNERPDCYVNLASNEYAQAVLPHLQARVVSVVFKDWNKVHNRHQVIGVQAKRARGLMVRYMAEQRIESVDRLCHFCAGGYKYVAAESNQTHMVFHGAR